MAAMLKKAVRRTTMVAAFGGVSYGGFTLAIKAINNDMDDLSYFFKRPYLNFMAGTQEKKKVVVLGSGWGAVSFVKKLDPAIYDVKVLSPRPFFFYTPLLVGSTTGVVSPGAIIEPIRDVTEVAFLRTECTSVDLDKRKVHCSDDLTLDYDHLVVAVGAQPNTFGIPGVAENAFFMKEIEHGRAVRKEMLDVIERADVEMAAGRVENVKKLLNFVVVGGGPTGVEFCGEVADFISQDLKRRYPKVADYFKITLVEALPGLLTMFHKSIGGYVQDHLETQGIDIRLNAMVKGVEKDASGQGTVSLANKAGDMEKMDYGVLIWVAGVGMRPFTKQLCEQIGKENGQTDRRGLLVDECLRVKGTKPGEVFAIGDCAVSGKPPTAQVAYQQGKYLGRQFRLGGQHLIDSPETPAFEYNHQGTMAYIGKGEAATEINPNAMIKLGRSSITDHFWWRSLYGDVDQLRVMGPVGFAIWRSTYFCKLLSNRNRWSVASDWMRNAAFGRPAASSAQGTSILPAN